MDNNAAASRAPTFSMRSSDSAHLQEPAVHDLTSAVASGASTNFGTASDPAPRSMSYLNPRSCITCRRRKVRCDKRHPCSNCVRAKIDCIFPAPGRAPRKSKKPADAELLARLKRLEGVVQNLGAQVDGEDDLQALLFPDAGDKDGQKGTGNGSPRQPRCIDLDPKKVLLGDVTQELGRLVIEDGRSRYVSNRFWASLGDEIEEMRDILDPPSSEDEDTISPDYSGPTNESSPGQEGFIFGFSSLAHSLRQYHPSPDQASLLMDTYKNNVAPLIPIFHVPTLEKIILEASNNIDSLNKNTEAMMFCVYYAAIASMSQAQCLFLLGEDRTACLAKYRFVVEQGMARANLMNTQSLTLIQGLVTFLICVRRQDDSRYVWAMIAIVLRIAQGLGIHRDGSMFGLNPFETEMRRRLWWHICILDFRAAEDHGCDPAIHEGFYDTRLPLNINEEDLSPDMTEPPEERVGCTVMTLGLIRCEAIVTARRISYTSLNAQCAEITTQLTTKEREHLVEELNKRLEERYVRHCDMTVPIFWACATVARLIVARLWLMIHQPMNGKQNDGAILAQDTRNRLFLTSIEILEFSYLLGTNENTAQWGWLFQTHLQWHAVAFLLAELCVRTPCPVIDRAWVALNSVYKEWETHGEKSKGMLWRSIRKLMIKATRVRELQLQQMADEYGSVGLSSVPTSSSEPMDFSLQLPTDGGASANSLPSAFLGIGSPKDLFSLAKSPSPATTSQSNDSQTHPTTQPSGPILNQIPLPASITTSAWLQQGAPNVLRSADAGPEVSNLFPSEQSQLSWEDWDQVVREFQMDMAQASQGNNGGLPIGGPIQDWFE
ncbi:hypothetical protein AJ80_07552 [Polytolypa hystricis UAMH7299]|uniref:C6 finger domain transcription factor nscR n=1 Tax=Polytolypa hystricis (strain UAMH7299) TaxID=1447883 RepID=A0A2B7XN09_POLH7|nr:hypothetical protein AJ80_07552 [Polytolypa hystricis UAMH7299]